MFVMFTDELHQGFETYVILFTGLWYGQEELEYSALLILLECYTINICAADISQKMISLQLKGYALTEWQLFTYFVIFNIILLFYNYECIPSVIIFSILLCLCESVYPLPHMPSWRSA
jgi:hypothetical protein